MLTRASPRTLGLLILVGFARAALAVDGGPSDPHWDRMVAVEEAIHQVSVPLRALAGAVLHRELPGESTRRVFADTVVVTDLERRGSALAVAPSSEEIDGAALSLWAALLEGVAEWERSELAVVRGRFVGEGRTRLETEVAFDARGRGASREVFWARGAVVITWERDPERKDSDPLAWQVVGWRTVDIRLAATSRPFFREVSEEALPDPAERKAARRSIHREVATAALTREDFTPPHPYFFVGSQDRHPGVSVVDVNADGFDDLYVMPRFGKNQLLVNQRDGTFRERAAELGLDIADHSAAAIFADFDNDGDVDAFVGRTLARSVYLENEDGRFVDASESFGGPLPALVSSVAAADYDGDGLLDLYVSTYAAQMIVGALEEYQRQNPGQVAPESLLHPVLAEDEAKELSRRLRAEDAHTFRHLPGPPNVLLRNRGGSFERVDATPLAAYRNTYQSTWADYDDDGDADLYVVNDFAPNQLFRNDGDGQFVDVTKETGTADIGFGMGASWGDYDGDGREDLYVSNMYSKAGRRITEQFPDIDPRFKKMARGNSLFRNPAARGAAFEKVSGLEPPALQVERAGWSWGGQFADVDNDADLDLYVLSGYYTAPPEVALPVDT